AVRDGTGNLAISLTSSPRAIEWNKGAWVLALTDFPRSTAMLDYQLAHSDDVASRNEALSLLSARPRDGAATRAIAAESHAERFWGLRARAVQLLAIYAADSVARSSVARSSVARSAVIAAVRDPDSRVRQSAVAALASFSGSDTDSLLTSEVRGDASPIVRGFALASYIKVAGDSALPLAREVMLQTWWHDVLRAPAMTVLKGMQSEAARELYQKYAKQ
ncbi:MAG: hypothetical protein ABI338_01680, partial [Gemmatimonadaceae bacterium]